MDADLPTAIAVVLPLTLALGTFVGRAYTSHTRRRLLRSPDGATVEMRVLADVAARDAARRHQGAILPEHLLRAATLDAEVADALAARGADAAAVRTAVAWSMFDAYPEEGELGRWIPPSASAAAALSRARARARAAGRDVAPLDLVPALIEGARGSWAERVLTAFGVDAALGPPAGRRDGGAADAAAPPYRSAELPETAEVVLRDDGAQRIERVAGLLCQCFGKDALEADHVVLTACHEGSARVGVYPLEEVTALVESAHAAAAAQEMHLDLTVTPADPPRRERPGLRVGAELTIAVVLARAHARGRLPTAADLLYALLCDGELASRVAHAGGHPDELKAALEAHLTPVEPVLGVASSAPRDIGDALTAAIAAARGAGRAEVEATDVLGALVRAGGPPRLEAILGAQLDDLRRAVSAMGAGDEDPAASEATGDGDTRVVFHNDDRTTMELVVRILTTVFDKTEMDASHLMLRVHYRGRAVAGVYARDVAEGKVAAALAIAREEGAPLCVTTESAPAGAG